MTTKRIQSELQEILRTARDDQEVATAITFASENAAKTFYHLANQVLFDSTLNVEFGEEDITEKLRHFVTQKEGGPNIQVVGNQVTGWLSKDLIQDLEEYGAEMGIDSISSQGPGGRRGRAWMMDL